MSDEKQPVKQALKTFYADKGMSEDQLHALQQALIKRADKDNVAITKGRKGSVIKWLGSIAASFLIIWLTSSIHTPQINSSAYADILKDKSLNTGMQLSMLQWLDENKIARVPSMYPVEMGKFCLLDERLTMHMRISGKSQGEMNVFFHHGERALSWFDTSGRYDDMNWKLLKVRKNLTLIVLYTQDMREKSVKHILNEMLPELEV